MLSGLKNKVVLVTGSTSGIGSATVKIFASLGSKVVITGRNVKHLESVAKQCFNLSPCKIEPLKVVCELTDEKHVKQLAEKIIEHFGTIDVFVNNASTFRMTSILDKSVLQEFDTSTVANNRSVVQLCNLLLPHLVESKGYFPLPSMAKCSIDALSKVLAHEFGPKGVRVNTVHVGAAITETTTSNPTFEEWKNEFSEKIPLRRLAEPHEIANAIVFLSSDMASYITGIELKCDGGMSVM